MKLRTLHRWDVSIDEAKSIQRSLAPEVSSVSAVPKQVRYVAGVDISGADRSGMVRAAVVVLSYPDLVLREVSLASGVPSLPYIPGLLSFRETPVLSKAFEALELTPDIVITDGHGWAHPRRFGIGCHIGLLTETPTIGCAKSVLVGKHGPLGPEAGSKTDLVDRGEVIGLALRTRTSVSPIYVSVGHKMDLESAAQWVLACCTGTRLPETTKMAHRAASGNLRPEDATGRKSAAIAAVKRKV